VACVCNPQSTGAHIGKADCQAGAFCWSDMTCNLHPAWAPSLGNTTAGPQPSKTQATSTVTPAATVAPPRTYALGNSSASHGRLFDFDCLNATSTRPCDLMKLIGMLDHAATTADIMHPDIVCPCQSIWRRHESQLAVQKAACNVTNATKNTGG
jgi:hypothetical protein